MSIIRVLREEISNRIAAGEVIERPASVVKELVDNAIDAGANRIFINIEKAGEKLIQVNDNGSGMDYDDALLCLEAHATSKIQNIDDLEKISTFGFRGEAIPSIASVSRFEINTRKQNAIEGTKVVCEGGTVKVVESVGCSTGTSISVKNLFFNVPARKKFLRSPATEEAHIHETALLLALSRLDIFLELRFDNRLIFSVPATEDLRTRAALLFGREMVKDMLPVNYAEAGIAISGLICRPGITRNTRKEQRLFVNGRPVDAMSIYLGIKEAYEGLVVKGKHPPCLLYFVMDPSRVDINVHPAKREVRFKENHLLNKITAAAISRTLRGLTSTILQLPPKYSNPQTNNDEEIDSLEDEPLAENEPTITHLPSTNNKNFTTPLPVPSVSNLKKPIFTLPVPVPAPAPKTHEISPTPEEPLQVQPPHSEINKDFTELIILGQYRGKYLITENNSGIVLLSISAAKERILFEKLQNQIKNKKSESQFLLLPISVELTPADTRIVNKYLDNIKAIGFDIEPFGGNTFVISATPSSFPDENINGIFLDIVDQLREAPRELQKHVDNFLLKSICRSALKNSHKPLNEKEIKYLLLELSKTTMPYSCPEGRPVLIQLSDNELAKKFGK